MLSYRMERKGGALVKSFLGYLILTAFSAVVLFLSLNVAFYLVGSWNWAVRKELQVTGDGGQWFVILAIVSLGVGLLTWVTWHLGRDGGYVAGKEDGRHEAIEEAASGLATGLREARERQ